MPPGIGYPDQRGRNSYGQNRPDPGRTAFGGLSGAMGAGMTQRTPAFFSLMEALQRGAQRAGQQQPGEPEEPDLMGGLPSLQGPIGGDPAAAPGTSPGMRSGIGMQTGAGFPRSQSNSFAAASPQAGMRHPEDEKLGGGGTLAGLLQNNTGLPMGYQVEQRPDAFVPRPDAYKRGKMRSPLQMFMDSY